MFSSKNLKIYLRICVLFVIAACLWLFSGKADSRIDPNSSGQVESQMAVKIVQMQQDNGIIPVELKCDDVKLPTPNALNELTCTLKNNTQRHISAGAVYTSLILERDGKAALISSYDTFDTFVHQDFREDHKNNLIAPGKEYRLTELPVSYSDDVVIKEVSVQVDYVEFADNSTLGVNRGGARVIGNLRGGAAKYKNWLAQEYKQKGMSLDALLPLLDGSQPLPTDIELQNPEQERGAIIYRKFALRTYKEKGAEGLIKHLKAVSTSLSK